MPASGWWHLNTLTTVQAFQREGVLQKVVINTRGMNGNRLTLYDGPSPTGPIVAIIDLVNAPIGTIFYDVQLQTGLTIVLDTGQAGDVVVCAD